MVEVGHTPEPGGAHRAQLPAPMPMRLPALLSWLLALACLPACGPAEQPALPKTRHLEIQQLSEHLFLHVSWLRTDAAVYACNGLVYVQGGEAIVFDTPADDSAARELIAWAGARASIEAVVVNHFHDDCLGGLAAFHAGGVPSYATRLTRELAAAEGLPEAQLPQQDFGSLLELRAGGKPVLNCRLGAAHSPDNIVSYLPEEQLLFGGCMIKAMGAARGNLADADTLSWAGTVARVAGRFPEARRIVPGHGAPAAASCWTTPAASSAGNSYPPPALRDWLTPALPQTPKRRKDYSIRAFFPPSFPFCRFPLRFTPGKGPWRSLARSLR